MMLRCLAIVLLGLILNSAGAQTADLIIVNARLFGADDSTANALAVAGDKIIAVGNSSEITKLQSASTRRIDAAGATVTPGLHDAHVHFLSGSLSLSQIDLSTSDDLGEIEATIRTFVDAHPQQSVFVGRGWLYGSFPGGLPDKQILDRLIPDRPAIMRCYDGHTVWVNSKALEAAKITRETPDPEGGVIVRDPNTGQATGVLKESAQT